MTATTAPCQGTTCRTGGAAPAAPLSMLPSTYVVCPAAPCCCYRSGGVDHFLWLTNDRGACAWPGDSEPDMANVMKVVHFGWANSPSSAMAHHFGIANKVREQQQQQQGEVLLLFLAMS